MTHRLDDAEPLDPATYRCVFCGHLYHPTVGGPPVHCSRSCERLDCDFTPTKGPMP